MIPHSGSARTSFARARAFIALCSLACGASSVRALAAPPAAAPEGADPSATTIEADRNETASETAAPRRTIGPTQPIGHSLKGVDITRRIKALAQGAFPDKREAAGSSGAHRPLVGGAYGFPEPAKFEGLPKAFVSLGGMYPRYGLVVEKLHHRLTVLKLMEQNRYEVVRTFRAITGRDPSDKLTRGDLRTPEGIYFVTGNLDDAQLPAKYGRMAFTLDYPNVFDQQLRKSGSGIWIHGTDDPKRLLSPFDTEGCAVVSNEDIQELKQYIEPFETPVVITKEMTTTNDEELGRQRALAEEMLEAWRGSWEGSDFASYMGFYSKDFKALGMSRHKWLQFKTELSRQRVGSIKIRLSKPKIMAFEDQLLLVFLQAYEAKGKTDFGRKFLYLKWQEGRYQIIAEKWYPVERNETALQAVQTPDAKM